jgi:threonine dehydrogenase-like Zn-dependent dehydrogenase
VQAAHACGAGTILAVDTVVPRLAMAERFGARAVHLTDDDPKAAVRAATAGRGADLVVDAVGDPRALDLACRLARNAGRVSATGVYAERCEVHMGVVWIKALTIHAGQANVVGHVDTVLAMMTAGVLDPTPLVTRHAPLAEAPAAYAAYARREALKIVLTP